MFHESRVNVVRNHNSMLYKYDAFTHPPTHVERMLSVRCSATNKLIVVACEIDASQLMSFLKKLKSCRTGLNVHLSRKPMVNNKLARIYGRLRSVCQYALPMS